jgi:hypothetical protein
MTYILSTATNNTAIDIESLTILTNSSTDISISAGTVVPFGSSIQEYGSDTYSVSSGVITLPAGYYYLLKCALSVYTSLSNLQTSTTSYQFYDTGASSYVGRRGWENWQEYPKLEGGDEYAIALVDATSSSKTIDCRIVTVSVSGMHLDSTTAQYVYAGYSRCEIYKWS